MVYKYSLSKKLAKQKIEIPGNPFWEVSKRFGRDELIAGIISIIATIIVSYLLKITKLNALSAVSKNLILALTGPIIEKVGFFPAHFKEAYDIYKTTPEKNRKSFSYYAKKALKGGSVSLLEDILVHDPVYGILMFVGLTVYPATPPWLLAFVSFIVAVLIVAVGEVAVTELRYYLFKKRLQKKGFAVESYIESRFLVDAKLNSKKVLTAFKDEFTQLGNIEEIEYFDEYFETSLPSYTDRRPKLRLRKRTDGKKWLKTAQIIYTKSAQLTNKQIEQYNYFPQKKDKLYFMLNQKMPRTIEQIKDSKVRRIMHKAKKGDSHYNINFVRTFVRSQNLLIATDKVINLEKRPFYVLEIKTRLGNEKILKSAMRFAMMNFPTIETTHGKLELIKINK